MEDFPTGQIERVAPGVRRVLAPNPSPFTYTGTQTYLVGEAEVAVIDPGPGSPGPFDAILAATAGERVSAILCTHTHRDHSPASRPLAAATGAPIIGCAPLALDDDGPRADAAFDFDYAPDRVLADGEAVNGPGWTLTAVATPGHTSNHLCFALRTEDGRPLHRRSCDGLVDQRRLAARRRHGRLYAKPDLLLTRDDRVYYPAHGAPVEIRTALCAP